MDRAHDKPTRGMIGKSLMHTVPRMRFVKNVTIFGRETHRVSIGLESELEQRNSLSRHDPFSRNKIDRNYWM